MLHVLNVPSPAATASLLIGRAIADLVLFERNDSPLVARLRCY
jgi:hypothetical protein